MNLFRCYWCNHPLPECRCVGSAGRREERWKAELGRVRESLVDAHQARERAERRAATWKEAAKRWYSRAWWAEQKLDAHGCYVCGKLGTEAEPLGSTNRLRYPEFVQVCSECTRRGRRFEGARAASAGASVFCPPERSAQVSSDASGLPGCEAQACKENRNMSKNGMVSALGASGAEGWTLSRGELDQPNQASAGRFQKTPCRNSAKRQGARVVDKGRSDGSSVQCERNAAGVQGCPALDAARSWARDWLDVYGQPTALWSLLMRFAALVAMRPGERRRLDEVHTVGLFEGEPGAMLWGTPEAGELVHRPLALVLPFGTSAFGRPLTEGEVTELEATLRGAIQRVEALGAEAEFFRHAAVLIRGDGFSDRWTAGADFRDMAGVPLDAPHPDAYRVSLVGAMRQAWAERAGDGPLPRAYPERVLRLAVGDRCVDAWRGDERPAGLLLDVLRTVNDDWKQTAKGVLELLTRAALAAEAEAESEVL